MVSNVVLFKVLAGCLHIYGKLLSMQVLYNCLLTERPLHAFLLHGAYTSASMLPLCFVEYVLLSGRTTKVFLNLSSCLPWSSKEGRIFCDDPKGTP